jgi:formylglycine-generating enzyme required for sulfatase activity
MSWLEAKYSCASVGKRLCTDDEFTFACEGPQMKPYPYGDGYKRDSSACNIDRRPWIDPWVNPFEVVDRRTASGAFERCHSDFGVYDIVGNVDEWVYNTRGRTDRAPWVSGLMGGHWVAGIRNRCRAITDSHEPTFVFYVTGARCCADAS